MSLFLRTLGTRAGALLFIMFCLGTITHTSYGKGGGGGAGGGYTTPCGPGCGSYTAERVTYYNNGTSYSNGGGGGGGLRDGCTPRCGPTPTPPPPTPAVCDIGVDKPVVEVGTATVKLGWSPSPSATPTPTLTRNDTSLPVPAGSTTYTDTFNATLGTTYTYLVSYGSVNIAAIPKTKTQLASVTSVGTAIPGGASGGYIGGTGNWGSCSGGGCSTGLGGGGGGGNLKGVDRPPVAPTITTSHTHTCSIEVKVAAKVTECNDGIDNADPEDTLIDAVDPACHIGGDIYAPYEPLLPTETLAWPELTARVTVAPQRPYVVGTPVFVSGTITNSSTTPTVRNAGKELMVRRSSGALTLNGAAVSWGGTTFYNLISEPGLFGSRGVWTKDASFTPTEEGWYEFCTVADRLNAVWELNENNNYDCTQVFVQKDTTTPVVIITQPPDTDPTGIPVPTTAPASFTNLPKLTALPLLVRKNATSQLTWDTGSRTQCSLLGTNGQTTGALAPTGTLTTLRIVAETNYTLSCKDDGALVRATIKMIPVMREI